MTMPQLLGFLPSTHGLHFTNSWPAGTPDYEVSVPPLGDVRIGDASNGLCGGMAFTVADLFLARRLPPSDVVPPAGGTPLFNYVSNRLLASFDIPGGLLTYYYWANTPAHDTGFWPVTRFGLAHMTIIDQLPQVMSALTQGRPASLGLVTLASMNPGDLGKCHQVLAYGYEAAGSRVTLRVYDPNQPNNDDVTISLDTSNPAHTTTIDSNVDCDPIRGFFYTSSTFSDPAVIAGPTSPAPAPGSLGGQAAFQANTGNLWIVGQDDRGDMGLGMMAGTSPALAALPGGGWQAAFQANTGNLWIVGQDDRGDMGLGMMDGTRTTTR